MIKKEKNKYNVYTEDGSKRLGSHSSKAGAQRQLAAIEISKHKAEAPKKKRIQHPQKKLSKPEKTAAGAGLTTVGGSI